MGKTIVATVVEQLTTLPDDLQRQVLRFVQTLRASVHRGVSGEYLLRFAGFIPPEDLRLMRQAIDLGCERIDGDEW